MSFKKKLMALGIALAFSIAAAVPAFASQDDPFWTNYPNLTPYNTAYNLVIGQGSSQDQPLMARAIDASWSPSSITLFPTSDLADDVTWSVMPSSSGVSVTSSGSQQIDTAKYAAKTTASIAASAPYGPYYVKAAHPTNPYGYLGFTITLNPSTAQSNVNANVRIYNDGFAPSNLVLERSNVSVAYNNISTGINYASAMDALAAVAEADGVSHTASQGSEFVNSVTFTPDGSSTPITLENDDIDYLYWTYCVYDANGSKIDLSYNVGSEVYNIGAGCTVVWYYGSWADFPDALPSITPQS